MYLSDPTFNELHLREKQMLLTAHLIWLNDIAQDEQEVSYQNDIINRLIDLVEVQRCIDYFIDYERSVNRFLNEARLENAKLKLNNKEMELLIEKLQNALDNAASNL